MGRAYKRSIRSEKIVVTSFLYKKIIIVKRKLSHILTKGVQGSEITKEKSISEIYCHNHYVQVVCGSTYPNGEKT